MGFMRKRGSAKRHGRSHSEPIAWLPFDSRFIPFFSFTHVRGVARVFLVVEMALSVGMLVGAFILVLLSAIH